MLGNAPLHLVSAWRGQPSGKCPRCRPIRQSSTPTCFDMNRRMSLHPWTTSSPTRRHATLAATSSRITNTAQRSTSSRRSSLAHISSAPSCARPLRWEDCSYRTIFALWTHRRCNTLQQCQTRRMRESCGRGSRLASNEHATVLLSSTMPLRY